MDKITSEIISHTVVKFNGPGRLLESFEQMHVSAKDWDEFLTLASRTVISK